MQKHIIIKSSPCANARDIVSKLKSEYGLDTVYFSQEFQAFTGENEHIYSAHVDICSFHELSKKVLRRTQLRLVKSSVILLHASSIPTEHLTHLGYVYDLQPSDYDVTETAEHIFELATAFYCKDRKTLSLVA